LEVVDHFLFTTYLGGGFKYVLCPPLLEEMIQFDYLTNIFQMG